MESPPVAPANGAPASPAEGTVTRPGADPVVPGVPDPVAALIRQGQFSDAIAQLEPLLQKAKESGSASEARTLAWQIEKLRRYDADYDTTRSELLRTLHRRVRDFQDAELDAWIAEGLVDRMVIDGEERFAGPTVSNLFFLSPAIRERKKGESGHNLEQYVARTVNNLRFLASGESAMLTPKRFHVEMTLSTKARPNHKGQFLRCWMPFPREYPFTEDIDILRADPEPKTIAPADAPQRTVYFETIARSDTPNTFSLTYEFTAYARVNSIDDATVKPLPARHPEVKKWTGEEAHVRFTPEMRALYDQIAGGETNAAAIARKCYLWIANNIRYSYAREYSTLDDIGYYCAARTAGDCGQEALLFITLCRLGGIPARWQSGWTCYPDWRGMHDWTEIYVDPYGWVPVDPYMGIWATRYMDSLTDDQKQEVRDFYFGSMDPYRLPANASHSAQFDPPKKGFRSDDVDNQRGEMEWADGTNLYFGEYKRSMRIREVPITAIAARKSSETAVHGGTKADQ